MTRWVYVGLALLAAIPLWQVRDFDFVSLDDTIYVTLNENVNTGLTYGNVRWALTTYTNAFWHPLTWLSLQLDASLFGTQSARGFHLENVFWHAANVLLLF